MVRYRVKLEDRMHAEYLHKCDDCTNSKCTNPIESVEIAVGGRHTERLWRKCDEKKPLNQRSVLDYYSVLGCDGYKTKKR